MSRKYLNNIYSYLTIFSKYCQKLLTTFLISVRQKNVLKSHMYSNVNKLNIHIRL